MSCGKPYNYQVKYFKNRSTSCTTSPDECSPAPKETLRLFFVRDGVWCTVDACCRRCMMYSWCMLQMVYDVQLMLVAEGVWCAVDACCRKRRVLTSSPRSTPGFHSSSSSSARSRRKTHTQTLSSVSSALNFAASGFWETCDLTEMEQRELVCLRWPLGSKHDSCQLVFYTEVLDSIPVHHCAFAF